MSWHVFLFGMSITYLSGKKKKKKNKTANEYIVQCESISNTFMYKATGIQCKH